MKEKMVKNPERKWRSKVTEGLRVKIPKDIADVYGVKKDDIVEWIFDEKGSIKIEIKEMVLREKKAKTETVIRPIPGIAVMKADENMRTAAKKSN